MNTRNRFEKNIIEKSKIINENGYVTSTHENLIEGVTEDLFKDDLIKGRGNELRRKFKALYSSSALVVNNFALIKKLSAFEFLGYNNFKKISFERPFETGLPGTPPTLDFVLENKNVIICFESKYLELLERKKAHFSNSYNCNNLQYIDKFWIRLIEEYQNKESFLDVAQLIKHSLGMINKGKNKKLILIYIYWTPNNKDDFKEYQIHQEELITFSKSVRCQTDIEFVNITYTELWNLYDKTKVLAQYGNKLRERYAIEI